MTPEDRKYEETKVKKCGDKYRRILPEDVGKLVFLLDDDTFTLEPTLGRRPFGNIYGLCNEKDSAIIRMYSPGEMQFIQDLEAKE